MSRSVRAEAVANAAAERRTRRAPMSALQVFSGTDADADDYSLMLVFKLVSNKQDAISEAALAQALNSSALASVDESTELAKEASNGGTTAIDYHKFATVYRDLVSKGQQSNPQVSVGSALMCATAPALLSDSARRALRTQRARAPPPLSRPLPPTGASVVRVAVRHAQGRSCRRPRLQLCGAAPTRAAILLMLPTPHPPRAQRDDEGHL